MVKLPQPLYPRLPQGCPPALARWTFNSALDKLVRGRRQRRLLLLPRRRRLRLRAESRSEFR